MATFFIRGLQFVVLSKSGHLSSKQSNASTVLSLSRSAVRGSEHSSSTENVSNAMDQRKPTRLISTIQRPIELSRPDDESCTTLPVSLGSSWSPSSAMARSLAENICTGGSTMTDRGACAPAPRRRPPERVVTTDGWQARERCDES